MKTDPMKKYKSNRRSGTTAVEMAMTLSVLFLIMFGAYELGRANMIMHTTEAAAYEGARVGIVPGATADQVEQAVRSVLSTIAVRGAQIETDPVDLAEETESLGVTVEVSFVDNSILMPMFIGSEPFSRTCRMAREDF